MNLTKAPLLMVMVCSPAVASYMPPPVTNVYKLEEATKIVTDRSSGKEWLQWTETLGMSIHSALNAYQDDGWRLASQVEMATLYSRFFPSVAWDTDEDTYQGTWGHYDDYGMPPYFYLDGIDPAYPFGELFGRIDFTELRGSGIYVDGEKLSDIEGYYITEAAYGTDEDGDGYYNWARARTEHTGIKPDGSLQTFAEWVALGRDNRVTAYNTRTVSGVALIRDTRPHNVPEPNTPVLLAIATLSLFCARRRPCKKLF